MLDGLDEIKVCVAYEDKQGNAVANPIDAVDYEELVPIYETIGGWDQSTVGVQSVEALPTAARDYIARLEGLVGAPIDIISTGPDRKETIVLRSPFG